MLQSGLGENDTGVPGTPRRSVRISPPETEAKLRRLYLRLPKLVQRSDNDLACADPASVAAWNQRAAADLARHGLRTCALPACGAKEPHHRFFKLCGRCRSVYYCCPEHSREDWKRHKREDKCKAAAS